jgi:hypothetical protein
MSSTIVRHGVLAGLGAAAGALVAAALMSTAPIASATPDYDSSFTIGLGGSEDTFSTTWDGTGLPVTTETTATLPTGEEAFGFSDISSSNFTIGADTFETEFQTVLFDTFSATGNTFEAVPPLFEIFSSF